MIFKKPLGDLNSIRPMLKIPKEMQPLVCVLKGNPDPSPKEGTEIARITL